MIINELNYKVFFVDYLDGKLNPSLVDDLVLFLNQNPDIKNDLEGIQDAFLIADNPIFPDKSNLKKKSFLQNGIDNEFDYLCIASVEGVITKAESASLQDHIKANQLKTNKLLAFQQIKIIPNRSIFFSKKHCLKRTTLFAIRYSYLRKTISVAASITLIIGVYTIVNFFARNNSLEDFSPKSISAVNTPWVKKPNTGILNNKDIVYPEQIQVDSKRRIVSKMNPVAKEEKRATINIEESIPNRLARIDLHETPVLDNQTNEIAQLAAKYKPVNLLFIDQLYAQLDSNSNENPEVGVFEAIQYGVKSVGKLFGSEIRLNANKDKNGNIKKIIFESQLVAFSAQVNNNE